VAFNPVREPPHLPAAAKRRYAKVLALGELDPRRQLLMAHYGWWVRCVEREYEGLDVTWVSAEEGRQVSVSDTAYETLGMLTPLFDLWVGKSVRSAATLERELLAWLPKVESRLAVALAMADGLDGVQGVIRETQQLLAKVPAALAAARGPAERC
jgi:hypothetical protein